MTEGKCIKQGHVVVRKIQEYAGTITKHEKIQTAINFF